MDPFLEKNGKTCAQWKRNATKMSVDELYNGLYHLATFGEWFVDEKAGSFYALGRSGGVLDPLKRLGRESRGIHVLGFTNKDLGAPTTIYTNLLALQEAIDKKYATWKQAQGIGDVADPASYVEQFHKDFFENKLRSLYVKDWILTKVDKIYPSSYHPAQFGAVAPAVGAGAGAPVGPTGYQYQLTFLGSEGNSISWLFSPTDVIYFCDYEANPASALSKPKVDRFKIYPTPPPAENKFICNLEKYSYTPSVTTLGAIINKIIHDPNEARKWKREGKLNQWTIKDKKNSPVVRWIEGYDNGIPVIDYIDARDKLGTRIIEIENINTREDIWRIKFALLGREGVFYTPTVDLYGTSQLKLHKCDPIV